MYAGRLVEEGLGQDLFDAPRHPYTQGLLAALPTLTGPRRRLAAIPGTVPEPGKAPAGCSFAPRCPLAEPRCMSEPPASRRVGLLHRAACHLQIEPGLRRGTCRRLPNDKLRVLDRGLRRAHAHERAGGSRSGRA